MNPRIDKFPVSPGDLQIAEGLQEIINLPNFLPCFNFQYRIHISHSLHRRTYDLSPLSIQSEWDGNESDQSDDYHQHPRAYLQVDMGSRQQEIWNCYNEKVKVHDRHADDQCRYGYHSNIESHDAHVKLVVQHERCQVIPLPAVPQIEHGNHCNDEEHCGRRAVP